jgi:hypothetical protein
MRNILGVVCASLVALGGIGAAEAAPDASAPAATAAAAETVPWVPAQGLWWNPAEHGIYYHVSAGPDAFLFVAITTYEPDGEPTFVVMQGPFEPTSRAEWNVTGVTGRLRSPLYRMEGGACDGCPYRNPRTVPSGLGVAEIEFRNDGRAVFRGAGRESRIERYPLFTRAEALPRERLVGRWSARVRTPFDDRVLDVFVTPGVPYPRADEPVGPIAAFAVPERLGVAPVEPASLPFNTLGARDDGTLRAFTYFCGTRLGCVSGEPDVVHERDGVLYVRGTTGSPDGDLVPYEATLRRLGPVPAEAPNAPAAPHPQDAEPGAWRPAQGLWWNPAAHGTYHHLSVGADGFLFAAITTYRADGEPTFFVMQGEFEPTPLAEWRATGVTGRLRSPLYRMEGGQALGGDYRNSRTVPSGLQGVYEFRDDGRAAFRQDGVETPLERFPLFTTADALPRSRLRGTWALVAKTAREELRGTVVIGERVGSRYYFPPRSFRDDELLSFDCVGCDPAAAARLLGSTLQLAAADDGRLRLLGVGGCTRAGLCGSAVARVLHERDGVLYGRYPFALTSDPDGIMDVQIVLQRIDPPRAAGRAANAAGVP